MSTENDERLPYHFSKSEISSLGRLVGDRLSSTGNPLFENINDELGIAEARNILSNVQQKILRVMGLGDEYIALMLTDEEIESLEFINVPQEIRDKLDAI